MAKGKNKDYLKLVEPWNEKPGIQNKLEIEDGLPFFEFDKSTVKFDEENPENDLIEDYKTARINATYCFEAAKAMFQQLSLYMRYDPNPLVADACVKLLKTISDNNRDLLKIQDDYKKIMQFGKPKTPDVPDDEDDEEKLTATVTEIVEKHKKIKAEQEGKDKS